MSTSPCPTTGYYQKKIGDLNTCTACPINSYCPDKINIYACPTGSSTSGPQQTAISNCICSDGQYIFGGACATCPVNNYCATNRKTACPTGSTSPTGSTQLSDCVCPVGYQRQTGACVTCAANSYCPGDGSQNSCPANSNTNGATGVGGIDGCLCAAGQYLFQGACINCPLNTYCPGNNVVTNCPEGYVTYTTGNDALNQCICPNGQYYDDDTQVCAICPADKFCNAGANYNCPTGAITAPGSRLLTDCSCPPGTYYDSGSYTCADCDENNYCLGGMNAQTACPSTPVASQSAIGASEVSDCLCPLAYYFNTATNTCALCTANHYCPGNNMQLDCPTGTAVTTTGSASVISCLCPATQYLSEGNCIDCPENSYCDGTSNTPVSCTAPQSATNGGAWSSASACKCPSGSYLAGTTCQTCDANYYCNVQGSSDKLACPANSKSDAGSQLVTQCFCNAGYYMTASGTTSTCTICDKNYYCPGNGEKNACSGLGVTASTGASAATSCTCPDGTYATPGNNCDACPAGSYCSGNSISTCPSGFTSPPSSVAATACICPPGQWNNSGVCTLCSANKFCPGDNTQKDCTNGQSGEGASGCICDAGYSWDSYMQECAECDDDSYCPGNNVVTACPSEAFTAELPNLPGGTSENHCICHAGNYMTGSECMDCPANSYCPGTNSIIKCPTLATSPVESDVATDCVCPVGRYTNTATNTCDLCPANSYCSGDNQATPCISGATSVAGATSSAYCYCSAGQFLSSGACTDCPAGSFCTGDNTMTACPTYAASDVKSTEFAACICPAGKYMSNGVCVTCVGNYYCTGNNLPTACPTGKQSPIGASLDTQCTDPVVSHPDLSNAQIIGIAFGVFGFIVVFVIVVVLMIIKFKSDAHKSGKRNAQNTLGSPQRPLKTEEAPMRSPDRETFTPYEHEPDQVRYDPVK